MWIPLVEKFGGQHNGYFLPSEGANNIALALFTFESLTAYEDYRIRSLNDPECIEAFAFADKDYLISVLNQSGFSEVNITPWKGNQWLGGKGANAETAVNFVMDATFIGESLEEQPEQIKMDPWNTDSAVMLKISI